MDAHRIRKNVFRSPSAGALRDDHWGHFLCLTSRGCLPSLVFVHPHCAIFAAVLETLQPPSHAKLHCGYQSP